MQDILALCGRTMGLWLYRASCLICFFSFLLRLWLDFLFEYSISNDISFGTRWWDTLPPQKITNGHQKIHIKHLIRRVLWKNTRGVFRIHLLGVKTGVFFFRFFNIPWSLRLNGNWPGVGVPMYGHPNYASWCGFSMSSRSAGFFCGTFFLAGCVWNKRREVWVRRYFWKGGKKSDSQVEIDLL